MRRRSVLAGVAAASACVGVVLALHYPITPALVTLAFLGWLALGLRRPFAWLAVIPALLPICGLATWTGWFAFEETDLLVLGAAAAGYAWLAFSPGRAVAPKRRLGGAPLLVALVLLFALSCVSSLYRGIVSSSLPQFDWIGSYESAMSSVRLFKSFAEALLLWPLLHSLMDRDSRRTVDLLAVGLALGLAGASLAALWERAAFTQILNFSSDYRTTALFWEMHVGGAALDAFLALTVPFAVWELRRGSGGLRTSAALILSALAAYACLTTFSRGVYLAISVSLACIWLLSIRQMHGYTVAGALRSAVKIVVLAAIATAAFYVVFRFGGYRALAAYIGVLGIAMHVTGDNPDHRIKLAELIPAIVAGALLGAIGGAISEFIPKGPYIFFVVALVCNMGYNLLSLMPGNPTQRMLRWALLMWLGASMTAVALHWGGVAAFRDSALAVTLLLVATVASQARATGWVPENVRKRLIWLGSAVLLATGTAVLAGGAYMGDRFAASSEDLDTRLRHWSDGIGLLHGVEEWTLGRGFGTFPGSYFFGVPDSVFPGSFALHDAAGERYLSLAGPRHPTSWGDLFRISQRVPAHGDIYAVQLDVRSASNVSLQVELCEQHLLYNGACGFATVPLRGGPQWQQISMPIDARSVSRGAWYAPRLAFFSMAVDTSGKSVDIRRVSLVDSRQREILVNGDFAQGSARWLPISERYHLPWHIKNLALNLIFDQGLVGLTLFGLLLFAALGRLCWGQPRDHPIAPYLAASLVGFAVVGFFDSLLDVPRVAFLFYLLLLTALVLPRYVPPEAE
jgi:hypothetical protein